MQNNTNLIPPAVKRTPWNKGQLIGVKAPSDKSTSGQFALAGTRSGNVQSCHRQ